MVPDLILGWLWQTVLAYPILSAPVIHVALTTFEALLMYLFFALPDWELLNATRLRVFDRIKPTKESYTDAMKLVAKNAILLWIGVAVLTLVLSGDINGNYSIQGIPRESLPLEAPTFLTFAWETFVVIAFVDFALYWMHRSFHQGFLYNQYHSVHHGYHDTVALHSMCAHMVEIYSALSLLFLVPRVLYKVIGIHPFVVYFAPFILTAHSALEHCGYDDYLESVSGGIVSGSKMHMVHHQLSQYNFGFYTYLWDYLFGTMMSYDDMVKKIDARIQNRSGRAISC